jgi:hypothetical protein
MKALILLKDCIITYKYIKRTWEIKKFGIINKSPRPEIDKTYEDLMADFKIYLRDYEPQDVEYIIKERFDTHFKLFIQETYPYHYLKITKNAEIRHLKKKLVKLQLKYSDD